MICLLSLIPLIFSTSGRDYKKVQLVVNQIVEPGDVIIGYQLYWFGLMDHQYLSWENLVFYRREYPGSNLEDAFRSFEPDIFIRYSGMNEFVIDEEDDRNYQKGFRIPKSELESFLDEYTEIIATIEDGSGSPLLIYRVFW